MRCFIKFTPVTFMVLFLLVTCTGCAPYRGISMKVAQDIKDANIEVHLVGVHPSSYDEWYNYSVDKYWSYSDAKRINADKVVYLFGKGKGTSIIVPINKGKGLLKNKWNKWKKEGCRHFVVLANLPLHSGDKPGNADLRRLFLPMRRNRYQKSEIEIAIKAGNVECLTPFSAR